MSSKNPSITETENPAEKGLVPHPTASDEEEATIKRLGQLIGEGAAALIWI